MNEPDRPRPRHYHVLRKIHPDDLTPLERFLLRLSDWSEVGAVTPIDPGSERPEPEPKPRLPRDCQKH
jgi:hypothetical protein